MDGKLTALYEFCSVRYMELSSASIIMALVPCFIASRRLSQCRSTMPLSVSTSFFSAFCLSSESLTDHPSPSVLPVVLGSAIVMVPPTW